MEPNSTNAVGLFGVNETDKKGPLNPPLTTATKYERTNRVAKGSPEITYPRIEVVTLTFKVFIGHKTYVYWWSETQQASLSIYSLLVSKRSNNLALLELAGIQNETR